MPPPRKNKPSDEFTPSEEPAVRRVFVTQAAQDIGPALCRALLRDDYELFLHDERPDALERLRTELLSCGTVRTAAFSLRDREAARRILSDDMAQNGTYWGAVFHAGLHRDGPLAGMIREDWDDVVVGELEAFYNVVRPVLLPMARRLEGRIVVLGSISGIRGARGQTNFAAAKAGLTGAARSLALEVASRRVTVNVVAPGFVESDTALRDDLREILPQIPLGRLGRPEEVAGAVRFLLSDAAAYITRAVIPVSGGFL